MEILSDGRVSVAYPDELENSLAALGLKLVRFARRCGCCGTKNVIVSAADSRTCMNCEFRQRRKAHQAAQSRREEEPV